jgi:hypothetical protein
MSANKQFVCGICEPSVVFPGEVEWHEHASTVHRDRPPVKRKAGDRFALLLGGKVALTGVAGMTVRYEPSDSDDAYATFREFTWDEIADLIEGKDRLLGLVEALVGLSERHLRVITAALDSGNLSGLRVSAFRGLKADTEALIGLALDKGHSPAHGEEPGNAE